MKILITGAAGFIGFHLVKKLAASNFTITGLDNINDYYDVNLKYARLKQSGIEVSEIQYNKKIKSSLLQAYSFIKMDICDEEALNKLFNEEQFDCICNLAAQAGVRYSMENPKAYINSNISGFLNILEACKNNNIKHLVFASSSSVYGINEKIPFSINDKINKPASLYAATKASNELMAHVYSHLYNIPATSLRYFTVYGPWGRPDMAYYKFTKAILENQPIEVYNNADLQRDFTYIDDVIEGTTLAIEKVPQNSPPFAVYNIGNNKTIQINNFIESIEKTLNKKAKKTYLGMQMGDVPITEADIDDTKHELDWEPKTNLNEGLKQFADWYIEYVG